MLSALLLSALLLPLFLTGCGGGFAPVSSRDGYGPPPPGYYRIRRGDTLSEIARRQRVSMQRLADWNGLAPPYPIYAGRLLRVKPPQAGAPPRSGASKVAGAGTAGQKAASTPLTARPVSGADAASSGIRWQWPLSGPVKQGFRAGDRTRSGIRIAAPAGTPVGASADGTVVYSGSGLKGYGNLIIVRHSDRYLSAYGYNRRLLVREGERVKRGQSVAEVGEAPNGISLLHFEIRKDGVAVDPLRFLPASR
ncbi:peptidoglycan DD-metalloendopeptidase family protein [Thiohalocapsa marina]|uniref:Peptidoglycan DD-metalloendopeptidase family protein n=2 Tax=Thiohalocapsa marina TaxID=424902 RepID=A0A5M8FTF4_9GAMM|nr:peptidoglycan DD-metalloendopeptidase family protein [Thiohalocapsa marina]